MSHYLLHRTIFGEKVGRAMGQVRDTTDRRRRIEANLPLVRALALRFARRGGEPLDDLVQAGCIGLIHAVDRFDPGRGAFESFAVPTITGEIRNHLRDRGGIIRAPADRSPQIAPIAEDDAPLADPIPGAEDRIAVAAALRTLPLHERRVVVLWLYGGRSQRRIAAEVGLSQIHVSRLLRRALERLRPALEDGPVAGPPAEA
ncbi:MAG: sigma-70 family RNA polymerase sigma factor [Solirubrobacteraceae bacterium]